MVRIVIVLVVLGAILRRIKRGEGGLGVIATTALGIAGAVIGAIIAEAVGGGSSVQADLASGGAALGGAILFVAWGEVWVRRRPRRPARR